MLLHTFTNILVKKLFGNNLVGRYSYVSLTILLTDVIKVLLERMQDIWDACQGNKLYAIYPNVGEYQCKSSLSRRDAVLIKRLRIGHT